MRQDSPIPDRITPAPHKGQAGDWTAKPVAAAGPSLFDPERFAHLGEAEVLRRIGALLALAVARHGGVQPEPAAAGRAHRKRMAVAGPVGVLIRVRHPVDQRLTEFLRLAGQTAPCDLARSLGISGKQAARRLRLLRTAGICEVVGRTRAAKYRLRPEFMLN